jgi:alpha-D-ribose 1-methylphosphonate 5-triphosphate synthase subunit PhnH
MTMKLDSIWRADLQQRIFRELLEAFSRPGAARDLTDAVNAGSALRAALACLMDAETSLSDPHALIEDRDWPLLQAEKRLAGEARYIVADGRRPPDFLPALGSLEDPEFGATIFLDIDSIGEGAMILQLEGPGVSGARELKLSGLHTEWIARRLEWNSAFPLGVDIVLGDARRVTALPRTTRATLCVRGR